MASLFAAEVHRNWSLAKARTKARGRVPWRVNEVRVEVRGLEIREAIKQATEFVSDLTITPENAKHWLYWGLIPKPKRRGLGQGKGMAADYPDDTPAQIVAAELATIQGFSRRTIARARRVVLEGAPLDADYMQGVPDLLDIHAFPIGYTPPQPTKKARDLAYAIRFYAQALAMARAGFDPNATIGHNFGRVIDVRPGDGENTITYFVSLPGLYLDPRVADDPRTLAMHKEIPSNGLVRVSGGPWEKYWQAVLGKRNKD